MMREYGGGSQNARHWQESQDEPKSESTRVNLIGPIQQVEHARPNKKV